MAVTNYEATEVQTSVHFSYSKIESEVLQMTN